MTGTIVGQTLVIFQPNSELPRSLSLKNWRVKTKKIYFVQNLIRKKQHIEAVRFICAYNVANKNQSVDLLQEHVQSAKVTYESKCKTTNSIEIKGNTREEIASLGTVLRCISDYNIERADLLNEIQGRIIDLKRKRQVASCIGISQMN
ncbi:frigida-LIKE protein [Medicago truncatula]|uniref:FRIGIDA-like protein n=1 Tax=Medicago truncatula TaxID=3880 RepID=A0A072UNE6_MEDTR|nr:frigida-LIKE protein [Medicago truncatula]